MAVPKSSPSGMKAFLKVVEILLYIGNRSDLRKVSKALHAFTELLSLLQPANAA